MHIDSTHDAKSTQLVESNGVRIAFVETDGESGPTLRYKVSEGDSRWSSYADVPYPDEIRGNGLALITVTSASTGMPDLAPGRWQVLVDASGLILLRAVPVPDGWQILANRYLLLEQGTQASADAPTHRLTPQPEARYARSGIREVPADQYDSPSWQRPDGTPFVEPTLALTGIRPKDGWFGALTTPSTDPYRTRWVFFTTTADSRLLVQSYPVGDQGWPDLGGDTASRTSVQLVTDGKQRAELFPGGRIATALYRRQEFNADGTTSLTSPRVAVASSATRPDGDDPVLVCVDFPLRTSGHPEITGTADDDLPIPLVSPARSSMSLTGGSSVITVPREVSTITADFGIELWVLNRGASATLLQRRPPSDQSQAAEPPVDVEWDTITGTLRATLQMVATDQEGSDATAVVVTAEADAPSKNEWHHIAFSWSGSKDDGYQATFFLDGKHASTRSVSKEQTLALADQGEILLGGNRTDAGLNGSINEMRWWSRRLTEPEVDQYLYRELPDQVRKEADLIGYWPMSAPGNDLDTVEDCSSYANDGTATGADWVTKTPPLAPRLPRFGLSSGMGVLAFAAGSTDPRLLVGADGLLHLYLAGHESATGGDLQVCHYDTHTTRPRYTLPWRSAKGEDGVVTLASHRAGPEMNRGPVIGGATKPTVEATAAAAGFVDVTLRSPASMGVTETFDSVPAAIPDLRQVLNGTASGDPLADGVRDGSVAFYDYTGTRPAVRLPTDKQPVHVITARSDDYCSALEVNGAEVDSGSAGSVTLKLGAVDASPVVNNTVQPVSRSLDVELQIRPADDSRQLLETLRGIGPGKITPQMASVYSLPTSGSPIQFAVASDIELLVDVVATDAHAGTATVQTTTTVDDAPTAVEWADVPTNATNFIATLNGQVATYPYTPEQAEQMAKFVAVGANNGQVTVGQSSRPASEIDSLAAFVNVLARNCGNRLDDGSYAAGPRQRATRTGSDSSPPFGSDLMQVLQGGGPTDGTVAEVCPATGALREPGNFGGWIPTPPITAGNFASGAASTSTAISPAPLRAVGNFTVEAWVRPDPAARGLQRLLTSRGPDEHGLAVGLQTRDDGGCEFSGGVTATQLICDTTQGSCVSFWWKPAVVSSGEPQPLASLRGQLTTSQPNPFELTLQTRDGYFEIAGAPVGSREAFDPPQSVPEGWHLVVWSTDFLQATTSVRILIPDASASMRKGSAALPPNISAWSLSRMSMGVSEFGPAHPPDALGTFADVALWRTPISDAAAVDLLDRSPILESPNLEGFFDLVPDAQAAVANQSATGSASPLRLTPGRSLTPSVSGPRVRRRPFVAFQDRMIVAAESVRASSWSHVAATGTDTTAVHFDRTRGAAVKDSADLQFGTEMAIDAWIVADPVLADRNQAIVAKTDPLTEEFSYELLLTGDALLEFRIALDDGTVHEFRSTTAVRPGIATYVGATCQVVAADDKPSGTFDYSLVDSGGKKSGNVTSTTKYRSKLVVELAIYELGAASARTTDAAVILYEDNEVQTISLATSPAHLAIAQGSAVPSADATPAPRSFGGLIAQMRLWSVYLGGRFDAVARSLEAPAALAQGIESNWTFTEGSGTTIKDVVGDHDAILSGGASWEHSAATARLALYIDGRPAPGSVAPIAELTAGYGALNTTTLGAVQDGSGPAQPFGGLGDEIRVWSVARTPAELSLYQFVEIDPADDDLAAYWPITTGNGSTVRDLSGHGFDLALTAADPDAFWWKPDGANESPVGIEAPQFINAVAGPRTHRQVKNALTAGSSIEVGMLGTRSDGRQIAIMTRQSAFVTELDGTAAVVLTEAFPVGKLDLTYVGQVQTDPTLIGFIEGAPPVPCENLTMPYWTAPARYQAYDGVTSVSLDDGEDVTYTFDSGRDTGVDTSSDLGVGWALKAEVAGMLAPLGIGSDTTLFEVEGKIGAGTEITTRSGQIRAKTSEDGRQDAASNSMSAGGNWQSSSNPGDERRYVPDNVGYALVRSSVANVFAMRLSRSGSMVGMVTVPDPNIKPDNNVIVFPIESRYTKQGSLDGYVGFDPDPDVARAATGKGSYFRPQEAADLEEEIAAAEAAAEARYRAYDTTTTPTAASFETDEAEESLFENWTENLVNSYVWTADGGLFVESQQASGQRTESSGGSQSLTALAGVQGEFSAASPMGGIYVDAKVFAGQHIDTTVSKTRAEARSISLEVTNDCESFLARWKADGSGPSDEAAPGKVTAYRFKSFYLSPKEQWFDALFDRVIDQNWLMTSDAPDAIALRSARGRRNRLWRLLHRVTYVARVPSNIDRVPDVSHQRAADAVIGVRENSTLIDEVARLMIGVDGPIRARVAEALTTVLRPGQSVTDSLPWWPESESEAPDQAAALHALALDYLTVYFTEVEPSAP